MIINDSLLFISIIHFFKQENTPLYPSLLGHIYSLNKEFSTLKMFHILCELNQDVDVQSNQGVKLKLGELMVNGIVSTELIPP